MHRLQKIMVIVLFLSASLPARSQADNTDSLRMVIKSAANDREKIKACIALSRSLIYKDFDESQAAAAAGTQLAVKLNDQVALSQLKLMTGLGWYFKGSFDSAAVYYYKALDIINTTDSLRVKAGILNEIGKLYRKTRDLDRSLQMYEEALGIYRKLKDEDGIATILNESGVVFEYKGNYEEAISRYSGSLAIRQKMNDQVGIGYSYNFLGGVYTLQKNYAAAEAALLKSLDIRRQLKDSFSIALSHCDLGYMYKERGMLDKALTQYGLSNQIAREMKFTDLQMANYRELADIAEQKGDHALSLSYYKNYSQLKDSVYTAEKMKQIEQLDAKYQAEKKEQQIRLQKAEIANKNYLLWSLLGGLVLVSVSGVSLFRKRQAQHKLKLQAEVMNQQELATKAVINAEENERKRIAADLHDGVGQMMSAARMNLSAFENEIDFKNENQKLHFDKLIGLVDESCKEIRNVSHQMMPNALLKSGLGNALREFIDKIGSRVIKINLNTEGLNERLDNNTETVLYRVIQECVNNVIKHSGADKLDISLIKDADGVAVTIEDNGKGFAVKDISNFNGIGLKNIISRVEYLKGTVEFDSAAGKGTLVAIHIPVHS